MSNYFKHTPQLIGATTSPVSDLALEVTEAFGAVETVLGTEGSTLGSFKTALGNALFSNLKSHKVDKEVSETHTLFDTQSDIILENKPNRDNITVSYLDSTDIKTLTLVGNNVDFNDVDQYKILGKVLRLNIRVSKDKPLTLSVDYATTTFDLAGSKFLPNVFKKDNGEFFLTPSNVSPEGLELDYGISLTDTMSQRITNPQQPLKLFYTYDRNIYTELPYDSYTIEGNILKVIGNYLPTLLINLEVFVYVENTNVSELVDALVYEFLNHNHANSNITSNISHKDIVNRFVNTNKLSYKESDIPNYEHPQYLNREGYNENLDAVYENSFVGNFFISRIVDEAVQKFKGLDEDSYKIMFGDPILGHTLHYSYTDEALVLSSFQSMNGLDIKTSGNTKYSLKLNGSVLKSNAAVGLHIQPESNILDIRSDSNTLNTLKTDKFVSDNSTLNNVIATDININSISLAKDLDGKSAIITSKDEGVFRIKAEVVADKITVGSLESTSKVKFNEIDTHTINFKDISLVDTIEEDVVITSKTDKYLDIRAKTKIASLEVATLRLNSLGFGDLDFSVSDNNDVVLSSETKKFIITALTQINDLTSQVIRVNELVADSSKLNVAEANQVKFGEVSLFKTIQDNLLVSSLTNKVIFDLPVEIKELTADKLDSPNGSVDHLTTSKVSIGTIDLGVNSDPLDGGLVVSNRSPDTSSIVFNNLVKFIRTEVEESTTKRLNASILNIGNISLFKTPENNLSIAGTGNKVIFTTKAEFVDIKTDVLNSSESFVDKLNVGKVLLAKTVNNDLSITSELNKLLITAPTSIKTLSTETLYSLTSSLDSIRSQAITIGKVVLSNNLDNLLITAEETFKVNIQAPIELANAKVALLEAENTKSNIHEINQLMLGGVTLGHSIDKDLIVNSLINKVIFQAPTTILDLTATDIETETLTSGISTLDTINNTTLNLGGVSFNKTLEDNVEVSSLANKIRFNLPVEFTNVSSFDTSLMNLHTLNASIINMGNLVIGETEEGDIQVTSAANSLSIANKLISKVFQPFEIRGENAKGFLNDIEMNILKIGNSSIVNYEGTTIIHPKTPEADRLVINTKTEIGSLEADKAILENTQMTKASISELKIGGITLKDSALEGTTVSGDSSDNFIDFKANAKFNTITTQKIVTSLLSTESLSSKSLKIGSILFIKDPASESARLQRTDAESKLFVDTPIVMLDASVETLATTGVATLAETKTGYLDVNGFIFSKATDTNDLEVNTVAQDTLNIKTPVVARKFLAEVFSANNYTFYNNDRISIDADNYLGNFNNRFQFVNNKPISFVGSSKDSGIALAHEENSRASIRAYVSANSGAKAVVTDKNIFIETDVTKGTYLLENTSTKKTKDGVVYGFNDTTAQVNISDLTNWFRSKLSVGDLEAYSGNFMVNEAEQKHGVSIGTTRISVTGIDTDCPPGLTIFESQDTINIVKPLSVNQKGCRDVIYQSINTGAISAEGSSSFNGTISITEDLVVNGAIGATDLSLNGDLEVSDATVQGNLDVKGEASFGSKINFKNDVELKNDLTAQGRLKARSLEVREDIVIGKSLQVLENTVAEQDLTVKGSLNLKSDLVSDGALKSSEIITEYLTVQNIKLIRNLESSGSAVFQGEFHTKSNATIDGNLQVNTGITVKENITSQDLYVLKDAIVKEKLIVHEGAEIQGKIISIGREGSNITLAGKLQFDTSEVKFNSPVSVYESFKVTGDFSALGEINNKGGINTDSSLYVKGAINCEATIETDSNIIAKSIDISRNLTVDNSITADNISTKSISIESSASIANLSISKSLSMPIDTSIVAGDVKFGSITQTQPNSVNSFSGDMSIAGNLEVLKSIDINQDVRFGDRVILNSNGFKGLDAKIEVDRIVAGTFLGSEVIQTPNHVAESRNAGALALANLIPNRRFARIDHLVCDSIAVFNQSLTADTIYYKDLIFAGNPNDDIAGSVNIIARRALYA